MICKSLKILFVSPLAVIGFPMQAADYKCHAFCGTPVIMSEMNILNTPQIPMVFSGAKDVEGAFESLQKSCKKIGANAVPLRYLHAPTSAQNLVKVVLVPALSGDVCTAVF